MFYLNWNSVPAKEWPCTFFTPKEIACKGTGSLLVNEEALIALNLLRATLESPVSLSSAYRSPKHNKAIGGSDNSRHMAGHAFDVMLKGRTFSEVQVVAEALGFTGFGKYETFIHIDRGRPRSWG